MKLWRKPFDQEAKATRPARVVINRERCKGCEYCVEFCPTGALAMSDEMNVKGYLLPKVVDESKCLGCGLCEVICPDFGIFVISQDGEGVV
ncbi:MAG: 4Fe-4S binding protein [Chloroflexi bacterium]|nr:4Fe-4S binding protein [Chloroflexota bacterium]